MTVHLWWFVVGAILLLFGDSQSKSWAAAFLATIGVVWALTTHASLVIVLALVFAVAVWTAAGLKYLRQPEPSKEPPAR